MLYEPAGMSSNPPENDCGVRGSVEMMVEDDEKGTGYEREVDELCCLEDQNNQKVMDTKCTGTPSENKKVKQSVVEKADGAGRKGANSSGNMECLKGTNSSANIECEKGTNSSENVGCMEGANSSENIECVKGTDSSGNTECNFKRGGWCRNHLVYGEKVLKSRKVWEQNRSGTFIWKYKKQATYVCRAAETITLRNDSSILVNGEQNRALVMGDKVISVDLPRDRLRSDSSGISRVGLGRADARLSESAGICDV